MSRWFVEQERRLTAELSAKFRGTASVQIEALEFPFKGLREEDQKNTERLAELFREDKGYRDWPFCNHIPAVIEQRDLDAALVRSGISPGALLEISDGQLELDFPVGFRLSCLRGRHRVLAAKDVLPSRSRRWTVDLFLSGMKAFPLDCGNGLV